MRVFIAYVRGEDFMTKKNRKRRKPRQIVNAMADGQSMLAAGKPSAEVYQKLGIAESTWMRWENNSAVA